jgi:hypothetical protein
MIKSKLVIPERLIRVISERKGIVWVLVALTVVYTGITWAAFRSRISPTELHRIHSDAASTYAPGEIVYDSWGNPWDSTAFNPFFEAIPVSELLVGASFFGGVIALGLWAIDRTPSVQSWPLALRALASFLIGYTLLLAPTQIVLMAIPSPLGPRLVIAALSIILLIGLMRKGKTLLRKGAWQKNGKVQRSRLFQIGIAGVIVAACLTQRLQSGRNFLVTDSGIVFLKAASTFANSGPSRFTPWWDQQSDEWVFNAPLWFGIPNSHFGLWAWATSSLAMAATIGIIAGFAWSVLPPRVRVIGTIAVTGLPLLASTSPVPWLYISLIGGQNPLLYLGMSGRYASIALTMLAIVVVPQVLSKPLSLKRFFGLAIFSSGVGFMTVSTGVMFVIAIAACTLWTVWSKSLLVAEQEAKPAIPTERILTLIAIIAAGACAVAAFSLATSDVVFAEVNAPPQEQPLATALLLAGCAICLLVFFGNVMKWRPSFPNPVLAFRGLVTTLLIVLVPMVVGMVISGNGAQGRIGESGLYAAMAAVLPGYDAAPLSRGIDSASKLESLSLARFNGVECWMTGHCTSTEGFLGAYGMVLLLVVIAVAALSSTTAKSWRARLLRNALLLGMAGMLVGFLITDFSGATDLGTAWIKTRFLETPLYILMIAGACTIISSRSPSLRIAGTGVIFLWIAIPLVGSSVGDQWITNLIWLAQNFRVGIS